MFVRRQDQTRLCFGAWLKKNNEPAGLRPCLAGCTFAGVLMMRLRVCVPVPHFLEHGPHDCKMKRNTHRRAFRHVYGYTMRIENHVYKHVYPRVHRHIGDVCKLLHTGVCTCQHRMVMCIDMCKHVCRHVCRRLCVKRARQQIRLSCAAQACSVYGQYAHMCVHVRERDAYFEDCSACRDMHTALCMDMCRDLCIDMYMEMYREQGNMPQRKGNN